VFHFMGCTYVMRFPGTRDNSVMISYLVSVCGDQVAHSVNTLSLRRSA
jgi:hypothetical protein